MLEWAREVKRYLRVFWFGCVIGGLFFSLCVVVVESLALLQRKFQAGC
jgi:hypothetical protein